MFWQTRKRWTARMLKRQMAKEGGGGFGFRPLLALRLWVKYVEGTEKLAEGKIYKLDRLGFTQPWLNLDSVYGDGTNLHWKYAEVVRAGKLLHINLSAVGVPHSPPPLARVAAFINLARECGVVFKVAVAQKRTNRYYENAVKQARLDRRWMRACPLRVKECG